MRRLKGSAVCAALCALTLALAFGAPALAQTFKGTVKIGVIEPLTGPVGAQGTYVMNGHQLAADEINAAGGVNGYKIELVAEDDKATPAEAVGAAHKLINRDRVKIIMGAFNSSCTLAVQEVTGRAKIVQVTPVSTAKAVTEQGNKYMFRYAATSYTIMDTMAKYMVANTPMKRFAFLCENTDQGLSGLEGFKLALEKHGKAKGCELVATEYYNIGDTDLTSQLTKMKNIAPPIDDIQTVALITEATLMLKQARALGWKPTFSFMGGPTHSDFIKFTGDTSEGILYASYFEPTVQKPNVQKFVAAYKGKYGKDPEMFAAGGYDCMYIVAEALKKSGFEDAEKIRDALAQTRYEGVQGLATFDEKGQAQIDLLVMTVKGGERNILSPKM